MSIWKYRYFVDVIDMKSFTKAGKKNYVSQTAISQQIAQLEKSLGGRLLHRGNGEITPTLLGEIVYDKAKKILEINDSMLLEVEAMKHRSVLRVGVNNSINRDFWKKIQQVLDHFYEEKDFSFTKVDYFVASDMMQKNELDVYIGYEIENLKDQPCIKKEVFDKNPIMLYANDSYYEKYGDVLTWDNLKSHPGYITRQYPCVWEQFESVSGLSQISLEELQNLETLLLKVEMNQGYTFVDSRFFACDTGRLYELEGVFLEAELCYFYRAEDKIQQISGFLQHMKEILNE